MCEPSQTARKRRPIDRSTDLIDIHWWWNSKCCWFGYKVTIVDSIRMFEEFSSSSSSASSTNRMDVSSTGWSSKSGMVSSSSDGSTRSANSRMSTTSTPTAALQRKQERYHQRQKHDDPYHREREQERRKQKQKQQRQVMVPSPPAPPAWPEDALSAISRHSDNELTIFSDDDDEEEEEIVFMQASPVPSFEEHWNKCGTISSGARSTNKKNNGDVVHVVRDDDHDHEARRPTASTSTTTSRLERHLQQPPLRPRSFRQHQEELRPRPHARRHQPTTQEGATPIVDPPLTLPSNSIVMSPPSSSSPPGDDDHDNDGKTHVNVVPPSPPRLHQEVVSRRGTDTRSRHNHNSKNNHNIKNNKNHTKGIGTSYARPRSGRLPSLRETPPMATSLPDKEDKGNGGATATATATDHLLRQQEGRGREDDSWGAVNPPKNSSSSSPSCSSNYSNSGRQGRGEEDSWGTGNPPNIVPSQRQHNRGEDDSWGTGNPPSLDPTHSANANPLILPPTSLKEKDHPSLPSSAFDSANNNYHHHNLKNMPVVPSAADREQHDEYTTYKSNALFDRSSHYQQMATNAKLEGDYQQALKCYNEAILTAPTPTALLYAHRAIVLEKLGQWEAAAQDCIRARNCPPTSSTTTTAKVVEEEKGEEEKEAVQKDDESMKEYRGSQTTIIPPTAHREEVQARNMGLHHYSDYDPDGATSPKIHEIQKRYSQPSRSFATKRRVSPDPPESISYSHSFDDRSSYGACDVHHNQKPSYPLHPLGGSTNTRMTNNNDAFDVDQSLPLLRQACSFDAGSAFHRPSLADHHYHQAAPLSQVSSFDRDFSRHHNHNHHEQTATTSTMEAPSAFQKLSWRMDPSQSMSDWRLEIFNRSTKDFMTYHVHRVVLCVGKRSCGYFQREVAKNNNSTTTTDRVTRIPLIARGCDLMPYFLDHIYGLSTFRMTTETAVGLAYLAQYLEHGQLLKECMDFIQQDLKQNTDTTILAVYLQDATYFDQHELVDSILQLASLQVPYWDIKKNNHDDDLHISSFLSELSPVQFVNILERVDPIRKQECSANLSSLLMKYCGYYRDAVTPSFLDECCRHIGVLTVHAAIFILELLLSSSSTAVDSYTTTSTNDIHSTFLEQRCMQVLSRDWQQVFERDDATLILKRVLQQQSIKSCRSIIMNHKNKNKNSISQSDIEGDNIAWLDWVPQTLHQAHIELEQAQDELRESWQVRAQLQAELDRAKAQVAHAQQEMAQLRTTLESTKTELKSQLDGLMRKRNTDLIKHKSDQDRWEQERDLWMQERKKWFHARNQLEQELHRLRAPRRSDPRKCGGGGGGRKTNRRSPNNNNNNNNNSTNNKPSSTARTSSSSAPTTSKSSAVSKQEGMGNNKNTNNTNMGIGIGNVDVCPQQVVDSSQDFMSYLSNVGMGLDISVGDDDDDDDDSVDTSLGYDLNRSY